MFIWYNTILLDEKAKWHEESTPLESQPSCSKLSNEH